MAIAFQLARVQAPSVGSVDGARRARRRSRPDLEIDRVLARLVRPSPRDADPLLLVFTPVRLTLPWLCRAV